MVIPFLCSERVVPNIPLLPEDRNALVVCFARSKRSGLSLCCFPVVAVTDCHKFSLNTTHLQCLRVLEALEYELNLSVDNTE